MRILLNFSANLSEALRNKTTRALPDSILETYTFNMTRAVKSKYRLTDQISADYSWDGNNVLDEFRYDKLGIIKSLNPGLSRQFKEQFTFNYNPELISWFKPKLMYQANYNWIKNAPIDIPERGGKISAQGRLSSNVNLKLTDIIEIFYTPESKGTPARGRRGRGD